MHLHNHRLYTSKHDNWGMGYSTYTAGRNTLTTHWPTAAVFSAAKSVNQASHCSRQFTKFASIMQGRLLGHETKQMIALFFFFFFFVLLAKAVIHSWALKPSLHYTKYTYTYYPINSVHICTCDTWGYILNMQVYMYIVHSGPNTVTQLPITGHRPVVINCTSILSTRRHQ